MNTNEQNTITEIIIWTRDESEQFRGSHGAGRERRRVAGHRRRNRLDGVVNAHQLDAREFLDIWRVDELRGITDEGGYLRIGSLTIYTQLIE